MERVIGNDGNADVTLEVATGGLRKVNNRFCVIIIELVGYHKNLFYERANKINLNLWSVGTWVKWCW